MDFRFKKVVIIEDNEIDRYVLETLVKNNNFSNDVINFSNGLEAINFLELNKNKEENLPDVIFLDIYMPLMDGHEFMELFSKINFENSSKCKVFVISSSIEDSDIARTKSNKNIINYITKPVTAEVLESL